MGMNKFLAGLFFFLTVGAIASPITVDVISAPDGLTIQSGRGAYSMPTAKATESVLTQSNAVDVSGKTFAATSAVFKQVRAYYDFAAQGGASTAGVLSLSQSIPANAIITKSLIDVITAPTSGGPATISLSLKSFGDIMADTAVTAVPSGFSILRQSGSTFVNVFKTSAASTVTMSIRTGALTAGKFAVFIDYMISAGQ